MKIILTQHVKERRKAGFIPVHKLRSVAKHLISQHNLQDRECGSYKFTQNGTHAVISKNKNKFIFITFFGPTGWVIDSEDFGDFECEYQCEEVLKKKKERFEKMLSRTKRRNRNEPLSRLNSRTKNKIESGLYTNVKLTKQEIAHFNEVYGDSVAYILIPKAPLNIAEFLNEFGLVINKANIDTIPNELILRAS